MNENTLSRDNYGNATSRNVNIVVALTYFRFDHLRCTNTHEKRHDLQHSWF